jgi:hypothetical protein
MDRTPECSLDRSYYRSLHVHLRHLLHRTIRPPVHPEHLSEICCEHFLSQQSVEKSLRCGSHLVLETHVHGHWN